MMNIASGSRVPGGALPTSARLDSRTTASTPNSISEIFASHTAPGLCIQSEIPAATPMLVMMKRTARNTTDSVDRAAIFHTVDAACSASIAGFQIVKMKISGRIQSGIPVRSTRILTRPLLLPFPPPASPSA